LKQYKKVAVGGTFDHFHIGHEHLIKTALSLGEQVLIGLTTDTLLQTRPKQHKIQSYPQRKQAITRLLDDICATMRSGIVPLHDVFGSSVRDPEIDALVVSTETQHRAKTVNQIRIRKGFKLLQLIVIDLVLAQDGRPISASRIRNNEIDRNGNILSSTKTS
jgi:pantetheine-phosphate adenylyltransferase